MKDILLTAYGLTDRFAQEATLYEGLHLARVIIQHRDLYIVRSELGELQAEVSGKLIYQSSDCTDFPVVGDWVMLDRQENSTGNAIIHHILRRKSVFVRKAAGTSPQSQIIAANIDTVFICMSLNEDYNLRRLERYLAIALNSMATPVIILTKADLCPDLESKRKEIATVSVGTDVIACSSRDAAGYKDIAAYVTKGETIAFIGSSGVGKSTLINRLVGQDILTTREIRADDDKGRHTTSYRQLLLLPNGGIVIDTPGMRELQVESGDLTKTFSDIEDLAEKCKYKNCSHTTEPGCAVRAAIDTGALPSERFGNFQKLQKEISYNGLNSRQLEQEKIKNMFGSKSQMKQAMRQVKDKKS